MSTDRDVTRIVRSWLEDGATVLPDRVLDSVLDQLPATPQRRAPWPARRFREMNTPIRLGVAAAALAVVAVAGLTFLPRSDNGLVGAVPSSTPSLTPSASPAAASPAALPEGLLTAGTYVLTPFDADGIGVCAGRPGCIESPADDSIRFTVTVPAGFQGNAVEWIFATAAGTGVRFERGGVLYSDPCHAVAPPDLAVGMTVDDFASELADHPLLDVTTPTDVTLAGYTGKYVEIQLPADLTACTDEQFRPWDPGIYAQGPSERWRLYILDVEGTRVVIQVMDYATTSAEDFDKLQAVVDSIQIEP